jgi:hypothetical protein
MGKQSIKKPKRPTLAGIVFGRSMAWKPCAACRIPTQFLLGSGKKAVCAQCHFLEAVQRDRANLEEVIVYLRDKGLCAYCGEYASDVEHVVPRVSRLPTWTVPACHECNAIAGGTVFASFEDKAQFIKDYLAHKYRHVLDSPEWDEDELAEMGHNLRSKIAAAETARKIMQQRISWAPLFARLGTDA